MKRKKILILIIILTVIIISIVAWLNFGHAYSKLSINEEKWNDIISARIENKNLVLKDIDFNDYSLIIDGKSNTLYYSLVNSSSRKYNPKVDFDSNSESAKIAILSDEITDEKIKNGHQFKVMVYNNQEYHIYNLVCTDFPILNLSYRQDVGDKHKNIPVKMYLFNNLSNSTTRVTISDGRLKTTQNGYSFSLSMITPGNNIRDNKISLLHMKPSSDYTLTKSNSDLPGKQQVALFINNEYRGIYILETGKGNIVQENTNLERKNDVII